MEIPFQQFKKIKPPYNNFNLEEIFSNESTLLVKTFQEALDEIQPRLQSNFCCLIQ